MKTTNYPGINYAGHTQTNCNTETGIRFGVIPSNDVSPFAMEDVYQNGTDLDFESAVKEAKAEISRLENQGEIAEFLHGRFYRRCNSDLWAEAIMVSIADSGFELGSQEATNLIWGEVEQDFCDTYESGGDCTRYSYEDKDGTKLQVAGDGDIFVLKSPYFTYAQFCSPCAPGACYLRSPLDSPVEANKCYCMGLDWFDDDNPCPYPVYSVETGELINPES